MTPPWYVLTGGPCSGKTTLINELKDRGYTVMPESARTVITAGLAEGKTIQEIVADTLSLERRIVAHQLELISQAPKDKVVFYDRGVPDNIAYVRRFTLPDQEFRDAAEKVRYRKVFLLDMIEFANDAERYETPEEAAWLHSEIGNVYRELGHEVIEVSVVPIAERADFVLSHIN